MPSTAEQPRQPARDARIHAPLQADQAQVAERASLRTGDQLFCFELAKQATELYFDRTWEQIEPILESTWENGDHEMSWCEARWFAKCAWTDCLNRGASGQTDFGAAATV